MCKLFRQFFSTIHMEFSRSSYDPVRHKEFETCIKWNMDVY